MKNYKDIISLVDVTVNFHCCCTSALAAQDIQWTEVAPGVWKGIAGKPEAYDLLKASGAKPYIAG